MTRRLVPLALLALALAPLSVPRRSAAATAPRYTVVDLGTLGGRDSFAHAVNNLGQVVGWAQTRRTDPRGQPVRHAFLWNGYRMRDLGSLPSIRNSVAYDLNDRAEVVGAAVDALEPYWRDYLDSLDREIAAFLWTPAQGMRELPPPRSECQLAAYAINERGEVVGGGYVTPYNAATYWFEDRVQVLFHEADGAYATDINDGSLITGHSHFSVHAQGLLLDSPASEPRNVATSHEGAATANAINNRGEVVGEWKWPFVWQDGVCTRLPVPRGGVGGVPHAINDAGWIVGDYEVEGPEGEGVPRALLWRDRQPFDLNHLAPAGPWVLEHAMDINARGEIAVVGGQRDRKGHLLRVRALLLRPVEGR